MKAKNLHLFEYNCLSYILMQSCFIGICLNNLLVISKQDSWISILLALFLGFIPLGIYYLIINHNPKENIIDLIKKSCGNIIGTIITVMICIFVFIFTSLMLWNLINFISSQYLYKTPHLAISIAFALALYYISSKGINVIGRTAVFFCYMIFILYFFSALGLLFQIDINNLKPSFEYGLSPILNGSLQYIAYNILPLFLITIIPKDTIENNKNFLKSEIIVYIFTTLSLFLVIFLLLSIYGIEFSQILQYPAYHLLKRLSIFGFIQRVESILSIQWILDMFITIALCLYFIKKSLRQTFSFKDHKYISFIIVVFLVIVTNYLFKNNTIGNIIILNVFPYLLYIFFLIIPAIIYLISLKNKNSLK